MQAADGRRVTPLARIDPSTGSAAAYRLALTSETGKISGLDCRARGGVIEAIAVERHFEVSRLLAFTLPEGGSALEKQEKDDKPIEPRVIADLAGFTNGGKRNFEGVVWIDERRAALIVDNQYRGVTGPNEIVWIDLPAP